VSGRPLPSTTAHLDALTASGAPGYLVISTPMTERARSPWASWSFDVSEVDAAAQAVADLDAQGRNVYVRTTTITEPLPAEGGGWSWKRGGAAATGAAVAFAVDLDVAGPGHRQANAAHPLPSTIGEAMTIVDALPAPSLNIATGGGAHLWWIFDEPEMQEPVAMLEEWADRIVAAAASKGLHVDRPDAARVLRACGTTRRKAGVAPNRVTLADADAAAWPEHGLGVRPWRPALYSSADLLAALPRPASCVQSPTPKGSAPSALRRHRQPGASFPVTRGPVAAVSLLPWATILGTRGYESVGMGSIDGAPAELWRRPGASSPYSIKCIPDGPAVVWSDACGLPTGEGLSKWEVVVELHFGGDSSAAGRVIRRREMEKARV
jgi:hypothetical protein